MQSYALCSIFFAVHKLLSNSGSSKMWILTSKKCIYKIWWGFKIIKVTNAQSSSGDCKLGASQSCQLHAQLLASSFSRTRGAQSWARGKGRSASQPLSERHHCCTGASLLSFWKLLKVSFVLTASFHYHVWGHLWITLIFHTALPRAISQMVTEQDATEPRHDRGWQGPLGPSAPSPAPAGPHQAGGPAPRPCGSWRPPRSPPKAVPGSGFRDIGGTSPQSPFPSPRPLLTAEAPQALQQLGGLRRALLSSSLLNNILFKYKQENNNDMKSSTKQQPRGQTARLPRSAIAVPQPWPAQCLSCKNAALNLPISPQRKKKKRYCGNVNFHLAAFQLLAGKKNLPFFKF